MGKVIIHKIVAIDVKSRSFVNQETVNLLQPPPPITQILFYLGLMKILPNKIIGASIEYLDYPCDTFNAP